MTVNVLGQGTTQMVFNVMTSNFTLAHILQGALRDIWKHWYVSNKILNVMHDQIGCQCKTCKIGDKDLRDKDYLYSASHKKGNP